MSNDTILNIQQGIDNIFIQLKNLLTQLTSQQYTTPSQVLLNATIGQHVRHIAELFIELEKGYHSGTINYEKRLRDYRIETDKQVALTLLHNIRATINRPGKNLVLEGCYNDATDITVAIPTNYYREVAYNLEHAIHHMALIRIGVNDIAHMQLPEGFGVAGATIKYRRACAQ